MSGEAELVVESVRQGPAQKLWGRSIVASRSPVQSSIISKPTPTSPTAQPLADAPRISDVLHAGATEV